VATLVTRLRASLPHSAVRPDDLPVLQRVQSDRERDEQAAVDGSQVGAELKDVAVAQFSEHAASRPAARHGVA
jgi:hypothetical protein